jgi:Phosphotransferase enzyme family
MQLQLSTIHFPEIGTITSIDGVNPTIGPILGIGGPFKEASQFYNAWATCQRTKKSDPFPERVAKAAGILSAYPHGPFTLSHPDFAYHNFIVDDEYNLLAVIDWDGALIRPIEFSCILPMEIRSMNPIFWKGGRLDNKDSRNDLVVTEELRRKYIAVMSDEKETNTYGIAEYPQPLRVEIALGIVRYEKGNVTAWEWLIDILESKDEKGDGKDFQKLLRELQGLPNK